MRESAGASNSIRACASCCSSGVNQRVVNGVSGRNQNPKRATTKVVAPSSANNLVGGVSFG